LLADRKAPLGWVYLKIYEDSSFEFILTGLRDEEVYPGIVSLRHDTLFFKYNDSIPNAGKTAVIDKIGVSYIDGKYPENVRITLNKLTK
jgi:hypothetical protein